MQVTVFGASGKVGSRVIRELVQRGHSVVAFVHSHQLPASDGVRSVQGDIYDRASVEAALIGSQAVISTLGSWGTHEKNVLSTAMEKIIPAMEAQGITRIITVTGNVAAAPGDKPSLQTTVVRALFNGIAPKILRDAEDHISMLAASSLSWTVLRSPVMVNGGLKYQLADHGGSVVMSRQAVAQAMVDLVETSDWSRQAPYLKQTVGNLNRASQTFVKQSTFHGSRRQVRGQVIRLLTEKKYSFDELVKTLADERAVGVIDDLLSEGLLQKHGQILSLQ